MHRILYLAVFILILSGCAIPTTNQSIANQPAIDTAEAGGLVVLETQSDDAQAAATDTKASQPESTEAEGAAPILIATDTPLPIPTEITQEETDWLTTVSVADGRYILGNPNAPIRLVDYSDFL